MSLVDSLVRSYSTFTSIAGLLGLGLLLPGFEVPADDLIHQVGFAVDFDLDVVGAGLS